MSLLNNALFFSRFSQRERRWRMLTASHFAAPLTGLIVNTSIS